jgi:hypothetical protein
VLATLRSADMIVGADLRDFVGGGSSLGFSFFEQLT